MNLNDLRLNAYKKVADIGNPDASAEEKNASGGEDLIKSVSRDIRRTEEPGHVPLVRKPVFQKVNRQVDSILENAKEREKNRAPLSQPPAPRRNKVESSDLFADMRAKEEAKIAAKTGTYFKKKNSATDEDVREAAKALVSRGLVKVPEQPKQPGEKESIYRRVAKFLVVIGVDEAAKIIPHLTEEQTEKIIPEIAAVQKVTPEEAEQVLAEFETLLDKARESGGIDTARTILTKAYGSERAEELLEKSVQYPEGKPFDYLEDANAERIGILIGGESPAVQALVLSQVEPKKAAAVIKAMDPSAKADIVMRLAKMKPVAPEVMKRISKSLNEKMLTQNTENTQNLDGRGVLAQILKRMDPLAENAILEDIFDQDPQLGEDLRKRLFTEEDVIGADDRFMQNKLHSMQEEDIALLIRGKSPAFREKILSNVSKNRAEAILEDEELREHVLKIDCDRITNQFYSELRRAWEDGDLRVDGRDDGEVYV
ncbi:MAG TPA: flagellar motor switch protein FliG [Treponema sp.]|nr:flagellar motor switch protein FliG [Treponema sp.]